jgi:transposase
MAATRRVIEISIGEEDLAQLEAIGRSRTAPASWLERARILLAYRSDPSTYAVGEAVGVTHQTVKRCLDRAVRLGVMEALDDSPRPGKAPEITAEAKAWLVSLACQKAKDLGYPHELWTTRLLSRHVREHAEAAGHPCLANIVQGTVCKTSPVTTSNRTRCATTSSGATRRSRQKWPMCSASIARSRFCARTRQRPPTWRSFLRREARYPGDRQYRTRLAAEAGRA